MKLVVFSDGHIGEYSEGSLDPSSGLNTRLIDTLNVWDWIGELAFQESADLVVFGGDRFKPHKPSAWMRDLADERMNNLRRAGLNIICLLGNHDMYDKAGKWHSYKGAQVWSEDGKIKIFEKPGVLDLNGLILHFLPYGFRNLEKEIPSKDTNILFFHDSIVNMSRDGKFTANTGIQRESIDREEFSLILGGHIHLRQELSFQNAPACHIGTPLERIQDGNQGPKGALIIDIGKNIDAKFIESPLPKILTFQRKWKGDLEEILDFSSSVANNIILLVIEHTGNIPPSVRKEAENNIRRMGASSAKVRLQADITPALNVKAKIDKRIPIGEQLISYVKQVDNDPELISHIEEIRRRGEAA